MLICLHLRKRLTGGIRAIDAHPDLAACTMEGLPTTSGLGGVDALNDFTAKPVLYFRALFLEGKQCGRIRRNDPHVSIDRKHREFQPVEKSVD